MSRGTAQDPDVHDWAKQWLVIHECGKTSLTCDSIQWLNFRFIEAINPYLNGGFESEGLFSTIYGYQEFCN
jgi:hypothetical protein